jgi:hypothetical protein
MPDLSYKSSSQIARRRVASRTSDADLNRSIEGSIAQVSVMWLLHRGSEVVQDRGESLEQQILAFSPAVFDAIETSYPMLRNTGQEHLWLIYFKGLLTANTHPHEQMVAALRNIASGSRDGAVPPPAKAPGEIAKPRPGRAPADDVEILEQIARGLADK